MTTPNPRSVQPEPGREESGLPRFSCCGVTLLEAHATSCLTGREQAGREPSPSLFGLTTDEKIEQARRERDAGRDTTPCHPYDEPCDYGTGGPCRNHGGTVGREATGFGGECVVLLCFLQREPESRYCTHHKDWSGREATERARCNRTVEHPPHPANIVGEEDKWLCPGVQAGREPSPSLFGLTTDEKIEQARRERDAGRATTGRVLVLLIPDEDFAWEVFSAASEQPGVERALMVNPDHPESVAAVVSPPARESS